MREKKEINIQIGERVKGARERVRLTQEQLAEKIDVSTQYISDLERGVVGVAIPTLKNLCVSLGVSSDEILFGTASNEPLLHTMERCRALSPEQALILSDMICGYIKAIEIERNDRSMN